MDCVVSEAETNAIGGDSKGGKLKEEEVEEDLTQAVCPASQLTLSGVETMKTGDDGVAKTRTDAADVTEEAVSMETDVDSFYKVCSVSRSEEVSAAATLMDVDSSARTGGVVSPKEPQLDIKAGDSQNSPVSSMVTVAMETDSELPSRPIDGKSSMETSESVPDRVEEDVADKCKEVINAAEVQEVFDNTEKMSRSQSSQEEKSENSKNEGALLPVKNLNYLKEERICVQLSKTEQSGLSNITSGLTAEPHEEMEIDPTVTKRSVIDLSPDDAKPPASDSQHKPLVVPVEIKRSPLTAEQKKRQKELLYRCIRALEYCLRRFSQHHKCRYRLAYIHFHSDVHKELSLCRDLLLGSNRSQQPPPIPHHALFNEKTKTNLFSTFWRIPEDDIDRPGSFCTHTYKSTELMLEVLNELKEWDSLVLVSNLLHRTPEAGKKYLRDNERHHLARKAFSYALEISKSRVADQNPKAEANVLSQLVLDVYECFKTGQKYDSFVKATEQLLMEAYEMFKATKNELQESSEIDSSPSLLDQALKYCQQTTKPQPSTSSTSLAQSSSGGTLSDLSVEWTMATEVTNSAGTTAPLIATAAATTTTSAITSAVSETAATTATATTSAISEAAAAAAITTTATTSAMSETAATTDWTATKTAKTTTSAISATAVVIGKAPATTGVISGAEGVIGTGSRPGKATAEATMLSTAVITTPRVATVSQPIPAARITTMNPTSAGGAGERKTVTETRAITAIQLTPAVAVPATGGSDATTAATVPATGGSDATTAATVPATGGSDATTAAETKAGRSELLATAAIIPSTRGNDTATAATVPATGGSDTATAATVPATGGSDATTAAESKAGRSELLAAAAVIPSTRGNDTATAATVPATGGSDTATAATVPATGGSDATTAAESKAGRSELLATAAVIPATRGNDTTTVAAVLAAGSTEAEIKVGRREIMTTAAVVPAAGRSVPTTAAVAAETRAGRSEMISTAAAVPATRVNDTTTTAAAVPAAGSTEAEIKLGRREIMTTAAVVPAAERGSDTTTAAAVPATSGSDATTAAATQAGRSEMMTTAAVIPATRGNDTTKEAVVSAEAVIWEASETKPGRSEMTATVAAKTTAATSTPTATIGDPSLTSTVEITTTPTSAPVVSPIHCSVKDSTDSSAKPTDGTNQSGRVSTVDSSGRCASAIPDRPVAITSTAGLSSPTETAPVTLTQQATDRPSNA